MLGSGQELEHVAVSCMYHAMAGVVRVCVDDTVGGGVVTSCVHGIGASLIE